MTPIIFGEVAIPVSQFLDIGTFFQITSIGSVISGVLGLALVFGAIAFVLYFVLSAIRWLTSGGDKGVLEAARNRMTNAFIGLVLIAAAWAVYLIVIYILGLPITTTGGPGPGPGPIPTAVPTTIPTPPLPPTAWITCSISFGTTSCQQVCTSAGYTGCSSTPGTCSPVCIQGFTSGGVLQQISNPSACLGNFACGSSTGCSFPSYRVRCCCYN